MFRLLFRNDMKIKKIEVSNDFFFLVFKKLENGFT